MKGNTERKIRNRKISIAIMEYVVALWILLVAFVMFVGKERIKQVSSYARPEEVSRYVVEDDEYLTRIRPLTEYNTFKEIAESTLGKEVVVYTDAEEREEVLEGIIKSGMIIETENEDGEYVVDEGKKYEIRVIGDMTGDGDSNITELTRIIREVIGTERIEGKGEEISGDFNGDGRIDIVDITMSIRYILYGELPADKEEVSKPEIKVIGEGEEEERENNYYNKNVEVEIIERGKEGEIEKTETIIKKYLGESSTPEKQTTTEKTFELAEEARYVIKAQSYGTNGTKSIVEEREIYIDKTIPTLTITREEVDRTQSKILIQARDNKGIGKYSIQRNGEEERSREGIDEKEIKGYVTVRENGIYKVIIEDHAGNKVEEEIEIRDLNNRYTVIFKNEDGSIISQRDYNQGSTVEVPQNPSKAEDNTYTYEFTGWNPEVEETVTENKEYTATYREAYKNYTVTFKDEDGTIISTKNDYHYGDTITVPENPSKVEDDTYTYRFIGWDKEVSIVVEGNVEYKAVYEATRKEYTITFKDENGTVLTSKTDYHYGDSVAVPQNPSKQEDNTYTYEFTGWSPEVEETVRETVTGNKEYTATYRETYKNYTVTFKDEDGRVISSKNDYHYGETVTIPENPSKVEDDTYTYRFIGWDKEVSTVVEGNVEYKAVYEATRKEYTITFKDENGTVLTSKTDYHYGDTVAVPQNPSKAEDNTYTYEFTGWSPEVEGTVRENKEYTATYRETYKNYTITFKDEDGTVISSKNDYHYGDIITVPAIPTKPEDETNTYEFAGWNQEVQETVTENREYIATYTSTYKNYVITFKDENGTVLTEKTDYHYGDTVAVPQNPSKQEDEIYTYEFAGWSSAVEETVTGNKEYIATYTPVYKNYTVTFKDEDGTVISSKNDYHYGDTATIPENPSKQEDETYTYEFTGWSPAVQSIVSENIEYTAIYEAKYKEYVVTFKQDTGEILSNLGYHYGDTVELPEDPHKLSTMEYAYTFTGWNRVEEGQEVPVTKEEIINTPVTKEVEYIATYESQKINYTLIFYNDDYNEETGEGTLIEERTYEYGQTITFPEAQKEETEEIRYVFDGWENLGTEEESPAQINIKFKAEYREEYYIARVEEVRQTVERQDEETGETIEEEQVVLEGKSYLTLKEAIEEAGRVERTIRMLKDTEESVLVEDDQKITINLNGKTITAKKTYVIKNYGDLIIVNNSEQEGKILEISEEDVGYGIYNRDGKVTVLSGTIAAETSKENGATYAIYNQSESPLLITGGSVIAEAKGANSISAGIYNLAGEEIKVTGGLVYGNAIGEGTTTYGIYNETEGKVEVEGGIIQAKASLQSGVSYGIYNEISEEVEIKGGEIIVQSDNSTGYGIYNQEGKVTLGEKITTTIIDETTGEEQEVIEERKGAINVTASSGFGVYNNRGEIEEKTADIIVIGTTIYGIYNNEGEINTEKGTIETTGTTSYGIYNNNEATIEGITINNKTTVNNKYGVYNVAENGITISNIKVTGVQTGIYNTNGNVIINEAEIIASEGIRTTGNNQTVIVEKANIETTGNGISNYSGTVILKDVTINSNNLGIFTNNSGNTEIGEKNNTINTEKPYIYGKEYAVYIEPNSTGNIKYYDGTLQGANAIYGGISDIEDNTSIKIETVENEGQIEEVATLQQAEQINIARIGGTEYRTLTEAINAVPENQEEPTTIEIINDSNISTLVEVSQNKNVVIDLKGHVLTTFAKGGIINEGILEVTDTESGEAIGKIISNIGIGITNKGKFILTNGTIDSNNIGIYNDNEVTINGGKINGKNIGIKNLNGSKIEINGGEINSDEGAGVSDKGIIKVNNGKILGKQGIYFGGTGDINILNGEIIGTDFAIYTSGANVKIAGGNIKNSNDSSIYGAVTIQNGTLEITGGKLEACLGIKSINANVIVGTKEGSIDNENPIIIGDEYGIYNEISYRTTNKFKFYDGKIAGKTEAIYGDIAEVEENKEVEINTETIEGAEYKVASLVDERVYEEPIAQIGETTYTTVSSLRNAISEIPTYQEEVTEVKILNNFNLKNLIEIKNNQNIVIDLNGKTITSNSSIINNGNLEITDNTETHEGKLVNTIGNAINNLSGSLKISKGNIEGTGYGICNYNAYLTIGIKDGEVDNDLVLIKSKTFYAVSTYSSAYIIGMYDGKTVGKYGLSSYINEVEEGYIVYDYQEEGDYITTLKIEDPVASTGGVDYYSLQEAIDNCENGNEVKILRNFDLKNTVTISEGKEIILDLNSYTIKSNVDITLINNGKLDISNNYGHIRNNKNGATVIQNNGILNLNKGTVQNVTNTGNAVGIAIDNNGTLNVNGGDIYGYTYGIKNNENATFTINSGNVQGAKYAIYNNSTNDINIAGGNIYSTGSNNYRTSYGIYNNAQADINITGGRIQISTYGNSSDGYAYGIYNNGNGDILITGANTLIESGSYGGYGYVIYNNGNGDITIEDGTINAENCQNLAYGIKNANSGKVKVTGGEIKASSPQGMSYGIENGISGKVEMTGGRIEVRTTEGTTYGINNISVQTLKVTGGEIKAEGTNGYGIYNNSSDLNIGENDGEVIINNPIIESDNLGIYIHTTDTKFGFYDGRITGIQAINTDVNLPEGYKIFEYTDEDTNKQTKTLMEKDAHIATFWNEGKTKIIAKVPFKATDKEIQEPTPPEKEGYIGLWTYYEIKDEDIETELYYVIKRTNGTKLQATDEYGLTWNYTYNNGEATDVYYESGDIEALDGIVNIPARLDGYPVVNLCNTSDIGRNIFVKSYKDSNTTVKQVIIPNSVTKINEYAFYYCSSLAEINIPNVTSIGNSAFDGCSSLTEVNMPNVTSIGNYAFSECSSAIKLIMPATLEILGKRTFEGLTKLEEVVLVGNGNMPDYSSPLFTYTPWYKSRNKIEKITIGEGITSIGSYAFYECRSLTEIKIPEGVTSIGNSAFDGCSSLTEVNMPNVTSIESYAFLGCSSLTEVNMPNVTSIGSNAFYNCNILTEVDMPNVTSIGGYAFYNCSSLTKIEIPNGVTNIGSSAFSGCSSLTKIEIPNGVTSIGNDTFSGCSSITEVSMPNVVSIGTGAFQHCSSLIEVDMPKVTSIEGDAFYNCSGLQSLIAPKLTIIEDTNNYWGGAFGNCRNLTVIDMPNVTSIGSGAFRYCSSLTEVNMPNVTSIGNNAFNNCINITEVNMPSVTSIEISTFQYCGSLTEVSMPNVTSIGYYAFNGCSNLTEVDLSKVTSIGYYAFNGCSSLTEVNMPNVTSIGNNAFKNCSNITEVNMPNVTSIESSAFYQCSSLTDIYFNKEEADITFEYNWNYGTNAYVHFGDSTHSITINCEIDGLHVEEVSNNLIDGIIQCGETYQFKVVDDQGVIVENPPITVMSQGPFTYSQDVQEEVMPDENGIYTIENVNRNKIIRIGKNNGEQGQAEDKNGITWNYTYQDGKATEVYYESGELGTTVDIPEKLDGYPVVSLYNSKFDGQGSIFATDWWQENRSIERVNIPNTVTNITYNSFTNCYNLSDVYVNNEETNLAYTGWQNNTNAHIHYINCIHNLVFNIESENIIVVEESTENEVQNVYAECDETYKFKLVNREDESTICNKKLYVNTQGKFTYSEDYVEILEPDAEGIYTIENVNRNKQITNKIDSGTQLTSKDANDITWQFTYRDGKAEDVHYYDGELGEHVEIPSELMGYAVTSLRNSSKYNANIFTKQNWGSNSTVKTIEIPNTVTTIGRDAFSNCVSLKVINIPSSVNKIGYNVFYGCISLNNIYIDNLEENIELSDDINQYGYVHYSDCKHDISFEKYTNSDIELETVEEQGQDGHIECNENYRFRLVDNNGNPVTTEKVLVRYAGLENKIDENARDYYDRARGSLDNSSNMFASDEEGIRELQAGEDGTYTVEKVHRNITIIVGSYQTTDENNITWNYSVDNGKAINVYYAGGNLGETVEIPSELDGHQVFSLYNKEESGNIFAKAEDTTVIKNVVLQNGITKIDRYAFYKLGNLETITIPESVTEIGYASFYNCESLREISIPASVTKIGGWAFNYCASLTSINIPDNVTEIGPAAFSSCINLESITLPTNLSVISDYLFINCEKLNNIQIPETVTSIGNRAFYNCYSIENLIIPDTVTEIKEYAFSGCSNLNKVKLSNSIISIESSLFGGCNNLTDINIPNGVTIIKDFAFGNCRNIENIEIPNTVIKIEGAFSGCTNLKDIYINNDESGIDINVYNGKPWYPWYGTVNAQIHYNDCTHSIKLRKYIEDSTEIESVDESIDNENIPCRSNYQFKLIKDGEIIQNKTITITELGITSYYNAEKEIEPQQDEEGLYTIYTIENISRNYIIEIGEKYQYATDENGITWEYEYEDGKATNVHYYSGDLGTDVEIPSTLNGYQVKNLYAENSNILGNSWNVSGQVQTVRIQEGITSIGDSAFYWCGNLTSIMIPNSITSIGNSAFYTCYNLESINLPDGVISIGYTAFSECSRLQNINLPDSITSIGSSGFKNCSSLQSIELPENLTVIEESLLSGCSNLKNITIKNNVTEIKREAFRYCRSLEELNIPDSVTSIGDHVFDECNNLINITISENLTEVGSCRIEYTPYYNNLPDGEFYMGKVLYKYKGAMPENTNIVVKDGTKIIKSSAFYRCENLISIDLPDTVTKIERDVFRDCTNLSSVTMSKNIKYIGEAAFDGCTSLNEIVIWRNVEELGYRTFDKWTNKQIVNFEVEEVQEGWNQNWNYNCDAQIVFGYTGE